MKQLLTSLKDGTTELTQVPAPLANIGEVLIRTSTSLVSAGTERMMVEFGQGNIIQKVRQQPDKVRMVMDKARTDGIPATLEAVRSKLDQPLALGYCNVGQVLETKAHGFQPGDRVVSNGKHAEIINVPRNLCAHIPDNVDDETASFTVLAAIGLQGIRLINPTLGERVVVIGLGLIGLLTVQMLRAQGCQVLGIDFDPTRLKLAETFGAQTVNPGLGDDVQARAEAFSRGVGVDAVLITASTKSSEPVSQAAKMCRQRGRIVLVGVTGLELNRADFYEKELTFQVSCSYGPGRYDDAYEQDGQDYPIGFVRWTEHRNFEAVLDLMSSGALNVGPLVTHRFDIEQGGEALALLNSGQPSLGILLNYPATAEAQDTPARSVRLTPAGQSSAISVQSGQAVIGFIGAGNYAGRVLIPAFKKAGAKLHTIASRGGVSAVHFGRKYAFEDASTDFAALLESDAINTIVIATRHNAHAGQVMAALRAGKHVFCEKPLCMTHAELDEIAAEASRRPDQQVMLGFNRRFAPQVRKMKQLLQPVSTPKSFVLTVNAGHIPADHWTQDADIGGGRILGEACHFIDLMRHLAGSKITEHTTMIAATDTPGQPRDNVTISLKFSDGSSGAVHYIAQGHKGFPKERIEVFAAGRVLQLDNFRKLTGWGWEGFSKMRLFRQDKGQAACASAFVSAIQIGGDPAIAQNEIFEVSRITIEAAKDAMK